ncbi:MAG: CAP domain-containing protein [Planctomycetota bacterium]
MTALAALFVRLPGTTPPGPCLAAAAPETAPPEPPAASREPTSEEALILEFMNRFRADPAADLERITPETSQKALGWAVSIDWDMYRKEIRELKSAPPLVFNLALLDAARNHSRYMISHGLGHGEDPDKPGFTGKSFSERDAACGYKGGAGGENCFRDAKGAWASHLAFETDFGPGGPGGMQPGRGHRSNMMNPGFKEVGPSAVPHGDRFSVTHNFGTRGGTRFAGGVIYVDVNRNQFYDAGEGRGGVKITGSDGSSTLSWSTGAYTLEFNGAGPVTITAEVDGRRHAKSFEAGADNVKFDWIIPQQADLDRADKLLGDVGRQKDPKSSSYTRALVALVVGTEGLSLDPERQATVNALAKDTLPLIVEARKAVRAVCRDGDPRVFRKTFDESRKPWRDTAADVWFKDCDAAWKARQFVNAKPENFFTRNSPQRKQLTASIEAARKAMTTPEFVADMDALLGRLK